MLTGGDRGRGLDPLVPPPPRPLIVNDARVYLEVVAGTLTESARRGALDTWRCWDKKERVGEVKEEPLRPLRRDSIASFWKFTL